MNYTKKAVRGTIIVGLFSVLTSVVSYLIRVYLARELTPMEYGFIYSVFAFFGLFSILQHMGLPEALTKFISEYLVKKKYTLIKENIRTVLWIQFFSATFFVLIIILLVQTTALHSYFHGLSIMKSTVLIYAFSILFSPLELLFLSIFRGFHKHGFYSFVLFLRSALILFFTFILAQLSVFKSPLYPIFYAHVLVYIYLILQYYYFTKKVMPNYTKIKTKLTKKTTMKLIAFGIPVILTSAAGIFMSYTDTFFLTFFRSFEEVGIYNVASPTARLLWFFSMSYTVVLLPLVSELWAKKEKKLLIAGVEQLYKYTLIIIIPVTLVFIVFPEVVLNVFFGEEYVSGAKALMILVIGALFYNLANVNYSVFSGIGKPKVNTYITGIAAGFNVAGNFFLIPLFGVIGAAFSTTLSFFIMLLFGFFELRKQKLGITIPISVVLKTLSSGVLFLVIMWIIKTVLVMNSFIELIIASIASGLLYLIAIFLCRLITISEIQELWIRIR